MVLRKKIQSRNKTVFFLKILNLYSIPLFTYTEKRMEKAPLGDLGELRKFWVSKTRQIEVREHTLILSFQNLLLRILPKNLNLNDNAMMIPIVTNWSC